jgi:hypothetical protein
MENAKPYKRSNRETLPIMPRLKVGINKWVAFSMVKESSKMKTVRLTPLKIGLTEEPGEKVTYQ